MPAPALTRALLRWFDAHQRPLPWRRNRDPYRIWLSEVMLQQTTVAAVIPYFHRFLQEFPTIQALAAAPLPRVLKLWEGLGYYRRARHLHAAARIIVAKHDGRFPHDPAHARSLPGVGKYIHAAVLSQAYDLPLPIVEANSLRVLARLHAYRGDPRSTAGSRWLWDTAQTMLPHRRPGDFNQALMELGARICKPNPDCNACPLKKHCRAFAQKLQYLIPPPKASPRIESIPEVAVVIRDDQSVLLGLLPDDAPRYAGLWELPHGPIRDGESLPAAARRIAQSLTGLAIRPGSEIASITYAVTRFRYTLTALAATTRTTPKKSRHYTRLDWIPIPKLPTLAVSSPQRKILTTLSRKQNNSIA